MGKEKMSFVDRAWLRMDDATNLMVITGLLFFKEPIQLDELTHVVKERLLKFERFRQRVVQKNSLLAPPYWEEDPDFDIAHHVKELQLSPPGDAAVLRQQVSQLMSEPLDARHPLWQLHLIQNYQEGCAVLVRIHHCIADGIALVRVLLSLTDHESTQNVPSLHRQHTQFESPALKKRNSYVPRTLIGRMLLSVGKAFSLLRLALLKPDPRTIFKGKLTVKKVAAWSRPLPLEDIKQIGKTFGATVNDVLLSVVSGALEEYLNARVPEVPRRLNIRAAVPINLRPAEDKIRLGNKFGLLFLSLPLSITDPIKRLQEVHRRSLALKQSLQSQVVFGFLRVIGMVPHFMERWIINFFGTKITAVMTNVPGPQHPIYLAQKQVEAILFWVPQSGRAGMGVSIFSYCGNVYIGIATDANLVPEPAEIVANIQRQFNQLKERLPDKLSA